VSLRRKIAQRRKRREQRVRQNVKNTDLLRISIFRSANHIYGQLIDDKEHRTLASCSTLELKGLVGDKKAVAHAVGLELAKRTLEKGASRASFDRGSFLYHGRVKAFAEGLREGGLQI
jgi:large subunit ribosomal protein L18